MILFGLNVIIALFVMAASGQTNPGGLAAGFLLGLVALSPLPTGGRKGHPPLAYGRRVWRIARLFGMFVRELALSGLRVARLALSPRPVFRAGLFAYPLTVTRDAEIALLANLITLTPGTLSVDVSADRRTLYVHALDARDPETARAEIRNGFERAILEAFR